MIKYILCNNDLNNWVEKKCHTVGEVELYIKKYGLKDFTIDEYIPSAHKCRFMIEYKNGTIIKESEYLNIPKSFYKFEKAVK